MNYYLASFGLKKRKINLKKQKYFFKININNTFSELVVEIMVLLLFKTFELLLSLLLIIFDNEGLVEKIDDNDDDDDIVVDWMEWIEFVVDKDCFDKVLILFVVVVWENCLEIVDKVDKDWSVLVFIAAHRYSLSQAQGCMQFVKQLKSSPFERYKILWWTLKKRKTILRFFTSIFKTKYQCVNEGHKGSSPWKSFPLRDK